MMNEGRAGASGWYPMNPKRRVLGGAVSEILCVSGSACFIRQIAPVYFIRSLLGHFFQKGFSEAAKGSGFSVPVHDTKLRESEVCSPCVETAPVLMKLVWWQLCSIGGVTLASLMIALFLAFWKALF